MFCIEESARRLGSHRIMTKLGASAELFLLFPANEAPHVS